MITLTSGNILEAQTEAVVNTVNCVGVMGKGIALQFKQAYPTNFETYAAACKVGEVQPGKMLITETQQLHPPRYIINFPTKRHWRSKSRLDDIEAGLQALVADIRRLDIRSIAIPPLGCGNGGLDWRDVRPRIEAALGKLDDVAVHLYAPRGAPAPADMPVADKDPKMTTARALFVLLADMYRSHEYRLGRLEMQKLAYFLQEAGQPLQLQYRKHKYGPFANNLNHVLQRMEGKYIRGYGDGSERSEIQPLPEAIAAARDYLQADQAGRDRLERVRALIDGFENPYGMELLSSVHWILKEQPDADLDRVMAAIKAWNQRKRERFRANHVRKAMDRLAESGFAPQTTAAAR